MFDLDTIERDWKTNSFRLSEDEILEIYRSEGVTLNKYYEERAEYRRMLRAKMLDDEKYVDALFGDPKVLRELEKEQYKKLKMKYPFPSRQYLSTEMQKVVVEGSLHIVFDSSREWYHFFAEKISMERIYYVCLETLIKSVESMLHCEMPLFELEIQRNIEKSMIKHVAEWEHIPKKQVETIVQELKGTLNHEDFALDNHIQDFNLSFDYDPKEESEKPSRIYERIKNTDYDVDYIKNVSSDQFMSDYHQALDSLDDIEKQVIQLSFDKDGNIGLTSWEIGNYLGIDQSKVLNIRKKAIEKLRRNVKLKTYVSY